MSVNDANAANGVATGKRLLDSLQNDLRCISSEAKKKYPPLKEATEAGIVRLRSTASRHTDLRLAMLSESPDILEPFFMACDTRIPKLVQTSLTAIQRIITFEAISTVAAINLINNLWSLMESGTEELKLLQTVTLLVSTNNVVQGDALSKALALCFRLHFTKNQTTNNTASATIRQLVSAVFERVQKEDMTTKDENTASFDLKYDELKVGSKVPPRSLRPSACDAFLLFQDLVQLVNADQPFWLTGLTEMTRTFGLELLELIFTSFPEIFFKHEEFSFLLKERVCPLVIKLFSPNIKYKHCPQQHLQQMQSHQQTNPSQPQNNLISAEKPFFPISMRLLRIVNVLIQKFYTLLITESEIFLSLLVKFLECDKPNWQRAIALEVIHKMCMQSNLIRSFCLFYDMKPHSSKIFRDIVTALGVYTQSMFISPPITPNLLSSLINAATAATVSTPASSSPSIPPIIQSTNTISSNSPITPQPAFLYRGIWIPVLFTLPNSQSKSFLLDQLDKLEPPTVPDGYGLTVAYHCLLEIVRNVKLVIEEDRNAVECDKPESTKQELSRLKLMSNEKRSLHESLLSSSWCGLVASFSLLLEASTDESVTESLLKQMEELVTLYGIYGLAVPRDCMICAICRVSLPVGYNLPVLNFKLPSSSEVSTPTSITPSNSVVTLNETAATYSHSRSSSVDLSNTSSSGNMNLLSSNAAVLLSQNSVSKSVYLSAQQSESDFRQQVVAVGTSLPCNQATSGLQQGPVMLTAKNLQCMKSVLLIAHSHGCVLNNSWHIVLTTLQHLVWILGLKPSAGGSLQASRPGTEAGASTSSLITTAAMSDLPVLSALLSRLFESSQDLDDAALLHLIDALIKLSQESMDIAYNNREPSLFAVAKLIETGIVNINRCDIFWKLLTSHLLEVCQHPHLKMREWGAEALTSLVKTALSTPDLLKTSESRKYMILASLQDMSSISHSDIRQKQLDCTLQILQSSGDSLSDGWPQTLDIVGAISDSQNENLIRLAFQCLQLIVNDFLPNITSMCLVLVVDTTAKFGSQVKELNVSLTAIGLLWNIADFLFQNQEKIKKSLDEEVQNKNETSDESQLAAYDCLWMSLFSRLGDLCTDSRPSIRKSASQTLFSTLGTHGAVLEGKLWQAVLWQVLFPLLDRVRNYSTTASSDKIVDVPKSMGITGIGNSGSILLHHSRNTAQKQWSETQVLTLTGVARVFSSKRSQLVSGLQDFEKAWVRLFEFIETCSMSKNPEVSISALKCFQEVLSIPTTTPSNEQIPKSTETETKVNIWIAAWKVWCNIGIECSKCAIDENAVINGRQANSGDSFYIPSQTFLTSHIQLFPYLFQHIKPTFSAEDFNKLSTVLQNSVSVPIDVATQAYLMTATGSSYQDQTQQGAHTFGHTQQLMLTPLQEAIFFIIETFQNEILAGLSSNQSSSIEVLLPSICNQLLTFSTYACLPPVNAKICSAFAPGNTKFTNVNPDWIIMNFVPFGERALRMVFVLYQQTASTKTVIKGHILHSIVKTLKVLLCAKYACPQQSTWKLAVNVLLNVLQIGLPVARLHAADFIGIWADLANCLEGFLFPSTKLSPNASLEDQQLDESLDVKVVEVIRDSILPYAGQMPKEFVLQIVSILNRGSIHSATSDSPIDTDSTRKLREEFARSCFETLLQFSFLGPKGNPNLFIQASGAQSTSLSEIGLVNRLAVASLLQRFHEVVIKYVEDEKLSGKCPLPRHRMGEISFVLQALATLAKSLKKVPSETVEDGVWDQLISLYPHLVDCTLSNCAQVNRSLREVLHEYKDLLSPPHHNRKNKVVVNGT